MTETLTNAATQDDRTQNEDTKIVIKMLVETEAEKTDSQITTNRVSAVIRDGLRLSDVRVVEAKRKDNRGPNPGIVIASVETKEQKEKLMKNKKRLRQTRGYRKVYNEDELSHEARTHKSNMATLLREIGREKDFVFANGKIQKRGQAPRRDEDGAREHRSIDRDG